MSLEFKSKIIELKFSYKKAIELILCSNSIDSIDNDQLFQELKIQFRVLGILFFRFLVLCSPAFLLSLLVYFRDIPLIVLFDFFPLVISIIAFLLVYLFKKHAGKSAQ